MQFFSGLILDRKMCCSFEKKSGLFFLEKYGSKKQQNVFGRSKKHHKIMVVPIMGYPKSQGPSLMEFVLIYTCDKALLFLFSVPLLLHF